MSARPNLFFIGPTGAGKSTIGKQVAEHFKMEFLDLDQQIEARTGAEVAHIFDLEGEAGFRRRESDMLARLSRRSGIVLATGGGAVLEPRNQKLLRARGVVVYLQTPVELQLERLARDKRRPLLRDPNRREILNAMAEARNPIYEKLADVIVPAQSGSVRRSVQRVIRQLKETGDLFG